MKTDRTLTILFLLLGLVGSLWAESGRVRFRATVTADEKNNTMPVCYGDYFVPVGVDEVLDDPNSVFAAIKTVDVCYTDKHGFKAPDRVEVNGYYWGGACPMQYCGRVTAVGPDHYIELASLIDARTAFTYQGKLTDDGAVPTDELYDFCFRLFDRLEPTGGSQIGDACYLDNVNVVEGHFTVTLNFGIEPFDGHPRWLEIGVRPGDSPDALTDPRSYTTLQPRQPITPTPYAIYAATGPGDSDNDWAISGDTMWSIPSGNVGIGTTNPGEKLHVLGNVVVENPSSAWLRLRAAHTEDAGIGFATNAVGANSWQIARDGASGDFLIQESFPYPPFSGATVAIEAQTGNVGIGTITPAAPLHVQKEGAGRQLAAYLNNPADGVDSEVELQFGIGKMLPSGWSLRAAGGSFTIANVAVLPAAVTIKSTGELGIGDADPTYRLELPNQAGPSGQARANAWLTYSSGTWKTNIDAISDPLEKLKKLRGVYFDWKESGAHDIGMIAEEVAEVIPEVVGFEKDSGAPESLDYARLVALLVEAVKELKAENDTLKQRHDEQVSDLTARLERMEAMMTQISNKSLERVGR